MIKGKSGFWLLVIVFSLITILVALNSENNGMGIVKEMDGTMGIMMKKQHTEGKTLADLFSAAWSHQAQPMAGDGSSQPVMKSLDTTSIMVILAVLPFILGASVLMIILWI